MSRRVAHRVGRPQAQQTDPRARLDAAVEPAAKRAAHPGLGEDAAARPEMNRHTRTTDLRPEALHAVHGAPRDEGEMNRSERIRFWIYVAMGLLCAALLVAAAISAIAS
jgi:hypothetical protein